MIKSINCFDRISKFIKTYSIIHCFYREGFFGIHRLKKMTFSGGSIWCMVAGTVGEVCVWYTVWNGVALDSKFVLICKGLFLLLVIE